MTASSETEGTLSSGRVSSAVVVIIFFWWKKIKVKSRVPEGDLMLCHPRDLLVGDKARGF